jgi:hypothetical protein
MDWFVVPTISFRLLYGFVCTEKPKRERSGDEVRPGRRVK